MLRELLVSTNDRETRVAVLEDARVAEVQIERRRQRGVVGNIYKGRVTRVLPGMQSAFVDLGLEKDAFLYVADVGEEVEDFDRFGGGEEGEGISGTNGDPAGEGEPKPPAPPSIDELLREGQEVVVQVIKDAIATKGVRITTHVTLPGRTLVYMPTIDHLGVSRRIENEEERSRLKEILESFKKGPGGYIVRTAGEGRSPEEISVDRRYLVRLWEQIRKKAERSGAPTLLHRDLDLSLRAARDIFGGDFSTLWVDEDEDYQRIVEFLDQVHPSLVGKVRLWMKSKPLFEEYGVDAEIENALKSKVWLKSGGYIVINQTEALVAVDVNTGKFVGTKRLEDTVMKTNLEAVQEIVRQIRLRDLGGLIVVDFIDMEEEDNRRQLVEALEAELKKDRSKNRMLPVSEFGLVEITRKRQRQSLERALTMPCPYCSGVGRIKSVPTIVFEIRREVLRRVQAEEAHALVLRVHPEIQRYLAGEERRLVEELEERIGMPVRVQADDNLHHEGFDIVLET
ncbi:Rne/Rng family ribonuclease [Acidobacteria bacterium ACD]|nr:MAG: Rne/Rng family ribonuclease [Acidobacteriota bacterium]MCE7959677.1 Rne/Rng family ribonuclease [Acidobacteria bacterium ACB2]MDL1949509.1 Rne/Rng family ribonuclease [Acidobacteria bacterium ACD]